MDLNATLDHVVDIAKKKLKEIDKSTTDWRFDGITYWDEKYITVSFDYRCLRGCCHDTTSVDVTYEELANE